MLDRESDFIFYKKYADVFLESTTQIRNIFEKLNPQVQNMSGFSAALMRIYQCLMIDIFPSCETIVQKHNFFSFSILCRSILDITTQIKLIHDIKPLEKQQEAIKLFLTFEGSGKYINKKGKEITAYQWQDILIKDRYTYRNQIGELGFNPDVFDYLSQAIHWNPKTLKEFVGVQNNHVVFGSEKLKMFFISSSEFIGCVIKFTLIFLEHLYPKEHSEFSQELLNIQKTFYFSMEEMAKKDTVCEN